MWLERFSLANPVNKTQYGFTYHENAGKSAHLQVCKPEGMIEGTTAGIHK